MIISIVGKVLRKKLLCHSCLIMTMLFSFLLFYSLYIYKNTQYIKISVTEEMTTVFLRGQCICKTLKKLH